jgi:hypothetical protein
MMSKIEYSDAVAIAHELSGGYAAIDSTIAQLSQMTATMVSNSQGVAVAPAELQKIFEATHESISAVIAGRRRLIDAQKHMITIKNGSNLKEVGLGSCHKTASHDNVIQAERKLAIVA